MILKPRVTRRDLLLSAALGIGASGFAAIAGPMEDFKCDEQAINCGTIPVCPTGTGECHYCTDDSAFHEDCIATVDKQCDVQPPEDGGCGVKVDGTCDKNDECIPIVTQTPCGRMKCNTQPSPTPGNR